MTLVVSRTIRELREALAAARAKSPTSRIALVPTLGALHAGNLALIARAHELAEIVVVSIFVNPAQTGAGDDLADHPSQLDDDVAALANHDVQFVFAPSVAELYPNGPSATRVNGGRVAFSLEGRTKPGHFDGLLTVITKLINITTPDVLVVGQKDAQQVFLIKQLVRDLNLPVTVDVVETEREADGLAVSSRNRQLDERERRAARTLYSALDAGASAADGGIDSLLAAAQSAIMGEQLVKLEYLAVVDPRTFVPVDDGYSGAATLLIAARVGNTRLIDNESIYLQ